jgi:uncharacterized protein (TIGR03435 family)
MNANKVVAAFLLSAPLLLLGQAPPSSPAFEAASIKPSQPGDRSVINRSAGGRFTADKATLKILVKWAYELTDDELAGGPKWTDSDRYDIVATPEQDAGNEQVARDGQVRLMLRSLLADRFKLAMHREAREMPAYVLSVPKDGPKLTATTHPPGPQILVNGNGPMRSLTFQAAPTSYIARYLSTQLHRKVVDETNVKGTFDCTLEWSPDMDRLTPPAAAGDTPAGSSDPGGPSIFTAIQKQLGLRLRMEKASVDVYVIDFVDRPSDN